VISTAHDFLSALPDAALLLGPEGAVLAANAHAREALQLDPIGLPVATVIRSAALVDALRTLKRGGFSDNVPFELFGPIARQFILHVAAVGTGGEVLVLLRDLTREQRIEKMRSDFVANASHEMRTPLASIMGSIETLQGAARNDAKARETFLGTMLAQAKRMKGLIDDLLTLSRIELNEHVRPNTRVALAEVAKQAKSNLSALAKESNVVVTLEDAHVPVLGDAEELLQVALNLLENAIKYGASGGRVEMTCVARGTEGVLSVRDFGQGIAEVHLPRLTERFYRVSTQESRARGGTGLGLAIVKHIVLRHRGRLDVTSDVGKGSCFSVVIPLYTTMP
jgi:two-component system, OmpR family, phosphate regulon sensor histidine kinase PhoR